MPRELPPSLRLIVDTQAGVVQRAQLQAAGVTTAFLRAQLKAGRWQRLRPRIYATFSGDVSRTGQIWAALLYADAADALASHETAAELWRLADRPDPLIHVTVPTRRRVRAQPGLRVHYIARPEQRAHPAKVPPVTRLEETVLDLVDEASSMDGVLTWVTRACQRRLTTPARLRAALPSRKRVRWRRELMAAIADVAEGAESPLELAYLRRVERAHGLPRGERQCHALTEARSQWIDVLYPPYRLVVELDGRIAHPDDQRFRDHRRDNYSTADRGWDTLRYGWGDTNHRGCAVAGEVAQVLRRNGWPGLPTACPDCVAVIR